MQIGIDVRLWSQTGVGRYIRNLVINLQNLDNKNFYTIFARSEDLSDIESKVKNNNWKIITVDIGWHTLKEQIEFPKILDKENLDLVHFPYFSVPMFYKKPFVVTIHDIIMYQYATGKASTLPFFFYKIKYFAYQKIINSALKKSKKILVPLTSVKKDLVDLLSVDPKKIEITYEGYEEGLVDKEKIKNNYEEYFLYVGNAFPHKNLENLINAFKIFNRKFQKVKLILVGKNDYFYKKFEEKEKENKSIVFLHDITDKELASLYKNALSFVSASLREGFGLPALEAIANGCPVILSDIDAFREVCRDLPLYFDPKNKEEIAQKMEEVFKDRNFYSKKEKSKTEILNFFTWEKMTKKILKIYESSVSLR